jgi:hypothetical protein
MNYLKLASGIAMAGMLWAACGDDDGGNGTPDAQTSADARPADAGAAGFPQPAGTVPVNFTVDDTVNKIYAAGDLQWKGGMIYDATTRKVVPDSNWGGPWATLYDDGPWTAGGHEPAGSTAGDNKWGVTVFATPPATGSQTYEYGLIDADYEEDFGNGWIWIGSNGNFTVNAGATQAITAQGITMPAFGTTDLQITVDKSMLAAGTWDTSMVRIKSSAWAWGNQAMTCTGDICTFTLSSIVGPGKPFAHSGLLKTGDKPEFIVVFGPGDGREYKSDDGKALATGVTAGLKAMGAASFTPVDITLAGNNNTMITVP